MSKDIDITKKIYQIRGYKVMLDSDLSELYQVETRTLNQAVARNRFRFPSDFMFTLTEKEYSFLRSQFVILENPGKGKHKKYLPNVFTVHGIAMLSSVLKSRRAVTTNIAIVRTFVKIREFLQSNEELAKKLDQLEKKHDQQFKVVFDAIRQLFSSNLPTTQKKIKSLSEN